jgi:F-type H+-transporting ATPase subunit g
MNSSSAPQVNPQVQKAVEAASKAYNTGAAHVKRVAGPVGEKLGGALGGRSPCTRQI